MIIIGYVIVEFESYPVSVYGIVLIGAGFLIFARSFLGVRWRRGRGYVGGPRTSILKASL